MDNIRLLVDTNNAVSEYTINEIGLKYLTKACEEKSNSFQLIKVKADNETWLVRLLTEESKLLVELACRIELGDIDVRFPCDLITKSY